MSLRSLPFIGHLKGLICRGLLVCLRGEIQDSLQGLVLINLVDYVLHRCGLTIIVLCILQWWCIVHSIICFTIE